MAVLPIMLRWHAEKSEKQKDIEVEPIRGKASLQKLRVEGLVPENQTPQQYRQSLKIDGVIWNSMFN